MREYKDYLKNEIDENGIVWHWIETPFFSFSDFEKNIEENCNSRLMFVLKDDLSKERVIQFTKDSLKEIETLNISEPKRDYHKLCFAEKNTNWFSDETLEEFERYLKELSSYKYLEFKKEFLKNKLEEIQFPKANIGDIADELTLKQLALKLVYEGKDVTRNNSKDFLINTKFNSGDKLYNEFKFYRNTNDRKSNPQSRVKLNNKIKLFKIVIDLLDDKFKPKALDELKILKSYLTDY
ncbi:hypothetical protein [Flavobacterium yafengii]|uniref:hypothetical protein n=1 Tax=Flavobacterium yafengii TaxID=3041253 RepID=UPI0024A89E03|nr:hypothetical protein [Flavobacterium yafengii]MDI5897019.1 hypothetical protein [Flavobacterium yafengii]